MNLDDMILISVDDHIVEPPDMFDQHLPAKYRDRAPHVVRKKDGTDVWEFEGTRVPNIGLNAVAGRPPEEYGVEPTCYDQLRLGCYDLKARIGDMNANGVVASLCFGSYPGFCGALFAYTADKELSLAIVQAYNDWHIDEWCGGAPGRHIPLAILPLWDPKLMVDEVQRVAKKGCHAVSFSENPEKNRLPNLQSSHWDPFWSVCEDEGTIICQHFGTSGGMVYPTLDVPMDAVITLMPISVAHLAADLIWSPILRKYPTLKFALSEGGIGWVPFFLERIDYVYKQHRFWTHQDFGDKLPSEVFREHIVSCFISDRVGIRNRDAIGVENITWECDYPHSDAPWPKAPELLFEEFKGVPDADVDKITHENAMRHFRFDPFKHIPKDEATVGALRAQATDVDLTVKSQGGKKPSEGDGVVTARQIAEQLGAAFAPPE